MKTKEEIQQEVAEKHGYDSFEAFMEYAFSAKEDKVGIINDMVDRYTAQLKAKTTPFLKEDILSIIRSNYSRHIDINEAELCLSQGISEYINTLMNYEIHNLRPIKLTKYNVPDRDVIFRSKNGIWFSGIFSFYDDMNDVFMANNGFGNRIVTHFMYKQDINE